MSDPRTRRPRLALPFTVLAEPDTVRLVAGEDFRYTLSGAGLDGWLPRLLADCDGRTSLGELADRLAEPLRRQALELAERLYGERVLVDGPAPAAHPARAHRLAVEGTGRLADCLRQQLPPAPPQAAPVSVLCQDALDYDEALRFNRRQRGGPSPWAWATQGPLSRGYVGPVFLPDAGPCLACLLRHFQALSPAPEIYGALIDHARRGLAVAPAPFPAEAAAVLAQLVLWKVRLLGEAEPPPAAHRLHVLEVDTVEVSAHRVFADPECPDCGRGS